MLMNLTSNQTEHYPFVRLEWLKGIIEGKAKHYIDIKNISDIDKLYEDLIERSNRALEADNLKKKKESMITKH